jgi:hypothetical protein
VVLSWALPEWLRLRKINVKGKFMSISTDNMYAINAPSSGYYPARELCTFLKKMDESERTTQKAEEIRINEILPGCTKTQKIFDRLKGGSLGGTIGGLAGFMGALIFLPVVCPAGVVIGIVAGGATIGIPGILIANIDVNKRAYNEACERLGIYKNRLLRLKEKTTAISLEIIEQNLSYKKLNEAKFQKSLNDHACIDESKNGSCYRIGYIFTKVLGNCYWSNEKNANEENTSECNLDNLKSQIVQLEGAKSFFEYTSKIYERDIVNVIIHKHVHEYVTRSY